MADLLGGRRRHGFGLPPATRRKSVYREGDAQRRLVAKMREDPDFMVLRLENAQRRTLAQVVRDKALGMLPGAPDLLVLYRAELHWLELKSEKGTVSDEQKHVHAELRARGQKVHVAYGYEHGCSILESIKQNYKGT